jgi:hypothetical protein
MSHLSEEQLILHYYSEAEDAAPIERHLDECTACRAAYGSLERLLNLMEAMPVPERRADYETRVWRRLEPHLARRWHIPVPVAPWRWAAPGMAMAALLVGAFVAARVYPAHRSRPQQPVERAADPRLQERILKLAVGDYLDRSGAVLLELANANPSGPVDISSEQERAAALLSESRLYHQTALRTGDAVVASVLDDLERVLLEITHAPSRLERVQVEGWRDHIRAEGVLFRMRVLGSSVQRQDEHKL